MLVDPDVTRTGTSLNNVEPFELMCNALLTSFVLSTDEDAVAYLSSFLSSMYFFMSKVDP